MKIGIDARPLMQPHYSGVSEYTFQLLAHLFAHDHANTYTLYANARKNLEHHIPNFAAANVTTHVDHLPNKLLNLSMRCLNAPTLDQRVGGTDIFFCPNVNFAAFSKTSKVVVTVHDLSFLRHPELFDLKHRLWHSLSAPHKLLRRADHLIAVSEHTSRDLTELLGIAPEKISVIHEGVHPDFATPPNSQECERVREKYNLPDDYLLFVGTLEPRKNIDSIIAALTPEMPPLVIAGKKGWKYGPIFEAARRTRGAVRFLEYVDAADKPALYAQARIFVWPSLYEGFGLPILEAQAMGVPVITGAHSSLLEVAGDAALLVNPDHIHEIQSALTQLLADATLRDSLVSKGYANVKRFSWERAAQQTLQVFEHLIQK